MMKDIRDTGLEYIVKIPYTKTQISRTFTIEGKLYEMAKKYNALRPKDMSSENFFVNFQNGKCT